MRPTNTGFTPCLRDILMHCENCPLKDRPTAPGSGASGGLMIIGEAPGLTEAKTQKPFQGPAGNLLRTTLKAAGIDESQIWFSTAVLCHPPGNKLIPSTVVSCGNRLAAEIREVRPTKILMVGATALQAIAKNPELETTYPKSRTYPITRNRGLGVTVRDKLTGFETFAVATWHPAAILRDEDLFRDFADDIVKIGRQDAPKPPPKIHEIRVRSIDHLRDMLSFIGKASVVSCDLETSGLSPIDDEILSIGFGVETVGGKFDGVAIILPVEIVREVVTPFIIEKFINEFPGTMVFHNGKFDYQFLFKYCDDVLTPQNPADTMLMRYLQDERGADDEDTKDKRHSPSQGLKTIAQVRYDVPDYHFDWKAFYETPFDERDWDSLYKYHAIDCVLTAKVYFELKAELLEEDPDLMNVHDEILAPASLAFSEIELHGALIDQEYLRGVEVQLRGEIEVLRASLQVLASRYGIEDFNPNAHPTVKKLFVDLMKLPLKNTEKESLLMARSSVTEEERMYIDLLMEFRVKTKTLSTYVLGILKRCDSDSAIRSDFKLNGTATGRLSSANPNLQNIPTLMGPIIKNAFIARPGCVLIELDESQAELRVAGILSGDATIIKAYREGRDIHRDVAAAMFKKLAEAITHFERYLAKYVDFGVIYGRQAASLASGWEMQYYEEQSGQKGWTVAEAQFFLDEFLNGFPGLRDWIKQMHRDVQKNHFVKTLTGRRRRFPFIQRSNLSAIQRQAVNSVIQSLASDICLTALIAIQRQIRKFGASVILTVHDSIMIECPIEHVDAVIEISKYEMAINLPRQVPRDILPFKADYAYATRWGEIEKD